MLLILDDRIEIIVYKLKLNIASFETYLNISNRRTSKQKQLKVTNNIIEFLTLIFLTSMRNMKT